MAKLRHVAMSVPEDELAKTASFYATTFGMRRVHESSVAILLSDDVVSLAIISDKIPLNAGHRGLHHIGFIVDDVKTVRTRIMNTGMAASIDDNDVADANEKAFGFRPGTGDDDLEHKFIGPNGVTFDIVTAEYANASWGVSGSGSAFNSTSEAGNR